MPIVRANDPLAQDLKHQVLTVLGKLCDRELSVETQRSLMDKLTELLAGKPMTEATFTGFGLQCRMFVDETTKESTLMVHIPMKYVAPTITEDRENQWIQFTITKVLDMDFHDSAKDEHE